jgi:hypothetical protein
MMVNRTVLGTFDRSAPLATVHLDDDLRHGLASRTQAARSMRRGEPAESK